VKIIEFERSDAYAMVDIEESELVVGPIRSARKVLQRTTTDLVRHATYSLAIHGIDGTGGAVALNLDPGHNDRQSTIGSFTEELLDWASGAGFIAASGIGVELADLGGVAGREAPPSTAALIAASAVGSMLDNEGGRVVIASTQAETELSSALEAAGESDIERIEDLSTALTSESKATFVRGKTGALTHGTLADTNAAQIIGLQPLTTTARGLAVAGRRDAVIVPDFVSGAGPYLAAISDIDDPEALLADIAERTRAARSGWETSGVGAFVAACETAEAHMRTWTENLPFGRPLAP